MAQSERGGAAGRITTSFTAQFALVLIAGLAAAVIVAPIAAMAVAAAGFHYPFPRIFDRVVMVALFGAILIRARSLRLVELLRAGFAAPGRNAIRALRGFAVACAAIAILFAAAAALGGEAAPSIATIAAKLPGYIVSATFIVIIEEGFFRAFLLGGMRSDLGDGGALLASSAIYALAHLVRAPAHFYVTGFDATAGLRNLGASMAQLADPAIAIPSILGLFLLGLVLGGAFLVTRTVYFSMGLHAGLVIGQKLWPKIFIARAALPHWLSGYGKLPLISGAAAWALTIAILVMIRPLSGSRRSAV